MTQNDDLAHALAAAELAEAFTWQPMDTFPIDGEQVLITDGESIDVASSYWKGGIINYNIPMFDIEEPTGWMRFPDAKGRHLTKHARNALANHNPDDEQRVMDVLKMATKIKLCGCGACKDDLNTALDNLPERIKAQLGVK